MRAAAARRDACAASSSRGGGEVLRRRRRHQRAGGADADRRPRACAGAARRSSTSSSSSASRSSRRSTATRSAADASWRWRARSASPPTRRGSGSRRSISASFPVTAGRSGWRGSIGAGRALELLLTGEQIGAAEAYRLGLVNRVVPAADLMAEAHKLAAAIAAQGADRGALHPRSRELRRAAAARRSAGARSHVVRAGGEHRGHARRHARVSREAHSRSSRGHSAVRHADPQVPLRPAGTSSSPSSFRASTTRSPSRCSTGRARRCARPARSRTTSWR